MVTHDDVCDSCGAVGRTCRMRWPDGETREMCGPCERQWQLIWRHFCERQPRQANRVRAAANRAGRARPDGGEPMTDGGRRETHIGEDGLFVPADLREFKGQIVFRTPRSTIQHFGNEPLDAYYGLIEASDFGDVDEMRDPMNPDLAPNGLRIKPRGENAVEFVVETEPEVRCDGGATKLRDTTRPPQSRRTQGRADCSVDVQCLTVPRSIHKSDTGLGRTQDTRAVQRRAKKRGVGAAHAGGDDE